MYENKKNEACGNCYRRGEWGKRRVIAGVNPTKIYFKHLHKYHNIQLCHKVDPNYYIIKSSSRPKLLYYKIIK
jgi:hypothetical protein